MQILVQVVMEAIGYLKIIWWIITGLFKVVPKAISNWQLERFFGKAAPRGKSFFIVLDGYMHPHPRDRNRYIKRGRGVKEDNGLIGEDDVMGASCLRVINYATSLFYQYRKPKDMVSLIVDNEAASLWEGTFVSIGSADSNLKTYQIENLAENRFCHLGFNPISSGGGRCYIVRDTSYNIEANEDVAVLLRIKNPRSEGNYLFVCAGLGEWGTSGCVQFLFANWKSLYHRHKKKEFCKVIRTIIGSDESAREIAHFE